MVRLAMLSVRHAVTTDLFSFLQRTYYGITCVCEEFRINSSANYMCGAHDLAVVVNAFPLLASRET